MRAVKLGYSHIFLMTILGYQTTTEHKLYNILKYRYMLTPRKLAVGQANIAAKEPGSSLRSICPAPTDGCQAPEEQISWLGGSHVCSLQLVIHIIHHNPTSQMDYDGL
jgi:hypothetical protein